MSKLFDQMVDMTKPENVLKSDSGSYKFENPLQEKVEALQELGEAAKDLHEVTELVTEAVESLEETPKASLYNLLDQSAEHLFELSLAITGRLIMLESYKEQNAKSFDRMQAWAKLIDSAFEERQTRDSEAWAEQQVKEIKEAIK